MVLKKDRADTGKEKREEKTCIKNVMGFLLFPK